MEQNEEHRHRYLIYTDGAVSELICECGVWLKSTHTRARFVEDHEPEEGRGTE